jgi:hypothetical protein
MVRVLAVTANNLAVPAPTISQPALGVIVSCLAVPLAVSAPTIGQSAVTKVLSANNLAVPAPTIGQPPLTKVLTGANLATGPPAVGAAAMVTVAGCTAVPLAGARPPGPARARPIIFSSRLPLLAISTLA